MIFNGFSTFWAMTFAPAWQLENKMQMAIKKLG
jgi:hypothetical protein